MKPKIKAYQSSAASRWNRIEMLVALYNGVIAKLEEVRNANANGDRATEVNAQVRAVSILTAIETGLIDGPAPEITTKVRQICEYVRQCILDGDQGSLASAILVLSNLRDGFDGIREEASRLEDQGEIESIDSLQAVGVVDDCVV